MYLVLVTAAGWGGGNTPVPIDLYLVLLGAAFVIYLSVAALVLQGGLPGSVLRWLMLVAVLSRVVMLLGPHRDNSDLWRYLWDGHLVLHGFNPHAYAPADPALDGIRDPFLFAHLNPAYNSLRTVYGPLASIIFAVCALVPGEGPLAVRSVMVLGDVLTLIFLIAMLRQLNLPESWALLHALHPLLLDSFAQRGQMEGILLPFLMLAFWALSIRRDYLAGAALAAAVLVKVVAVILVPLVLWTRGRGNGPRLRRITLGMMAVGVPGALPIFLAGWDGLGGLVSYAAQWRTNAFLFDVMEAYLSRPGASMLALGAVLVVLGYLARRSQREERERALLANSGFILLTVLLFAPAVFPWYLTWGLPFAPFLLATRRGCYFGWAVMVWSGTVLLWYLRFLVYPPCSEPMFPTLVQPLRIASGTLVEPWRVVEYLPVVALVVGGILNPSPRFPWATPRETEVRGPSNLTRTGASEEGQLPDAGPRPCPNAPR